MFELGKTYRQVGTDHMFEPQFIGVKNAFGTLTAKNIVVELSISHDCVPTYYEIYKEPRSIEPVWFNIFVNMSEPDKLWLSGTPYKRKEAAQYYAELYMKGTILVDTIQVCYTEGSRNA